MYIKDLTERYSEGFRIKDNLVNDAEYQAYKSIEEECKRAKEEYLAQASERDKGRKKIKKAIRKILENPAEDWFGEDDILGQHFMFMKLDEKNYIALEYEVTLTESRKKEKRYKLLEITDRSNMMDEAYRFLRIAECN